MAWQARSPSPSMPSWPPASRCARPTKKLEDAFWPPTTPSPRRTTATAISAPRRKPPASTRPMTKVFPGSSARGPSSSSAGASPTPPETPSSAFPASESDLPELPFRHLGWFTAEHAEVFFAALPGSASSTSRSSTRPDRRSCFCTGPLGWANSSLLDAGLVPRLESGGHAVRYCRRDQQKGLSGSLRDTLQIVGGQAALDEGWRAYERSRRPQIHRPPRLINPLLADVADSPAVSSVSAGCWLDPLARLQVPSSSAKSTVSVRSGLLRNPRVTR